MSSGLRIVPTNGANCRYLVRLTFEASATRYKLAKKDLTTVCRSPLQCLSQQNDGSKEKGYTTIRVAYLSLGGEFLF